MRLIIYERQNKKKMYVDYSRAASHPNTAACMQGRP